MMKEQVLKALNDQLNYEILSSHLYLSMACHAEHIGLKGVAHWFHIQAKEEYAHAMKFYGYINDRGGKVIIDAVDKPQNNWESPLLLFENSLEHEESVTERINNLMSLAQTQQDYATANFLQWFIGEQVEEEASVKEIIDKINLTKSSAEGLFMLDNELMQRVFVDPNAQKA